MLIMQKSIMRNMSDTKANRKNHFGMFKICNIKSIRCTNLEKMAENLYFFINYANYAYLIMQNMVDDMLKSCRPFSTFKMCNIKSIAGTNLEKMAENPYFCINYANYAYLIMQNMSDTMVKSSRLFSTIIICNIKSLHVPNWRKSSLPKSCPGMPKS